MLRSLRAWGAAGLLIWFLIFGVCLPAWGQETNQFYLAAQYDWGASRGFFFVVQGTPRGNQPAEIDDANLTLGIGDGHAWHFISGRAPFKSGTKYQVAAKIQNGAVAIELNGRALASGNDGFAAANGPLLYDQTSTVMRAAADYQVSQETLHVRSGDQSRDLRATRSEMPAQLLMLNPATGGGQADFQTGDAVELQTTFQFEPKGSLRKLSPFIDRYGQSVQADWAGKVRSDGDLKAAQKIEAQRFTEWGVREDVDRYGGSETAGWTESKTGFFHTVKHEGKWWLISPLGNPCFYIGLCNAPAWVWEDTPITGREYLFSWLPENSGAFAPACIDDAWHINDGQAYVCFHTANMIREFGRGWKEQATQSAVRRVHALGFCGFGKWSEADLGVSDLPVLWNHGPNLVKHPDVFDPRVREQMAAILRQQIEPRKDDPWLLGWSVGNEKDEDITGDEIRQILKMDEPTPARRALVQMAGSAAADDATIEKMREYYERTYYAFVYKTVKSIDPNHLYFGNWVTPNWWENENDWKIAAANCDVLGFDWYADHFHADPGARLMAEMDKPILCGEFSFPPTYAGQRGYGTYGTHVTTEAEAGEKYGRWIHDAASDRHCVGAFYFQYRDEPLTGRGPGNSRDTLVVGEDFAFGLVDVTDRIKWDFAEAVRKANLAAVSIRRHGAEQ